MYFTDPYTPSALAATGITAAYGLIGVAVLIFSGLAAITIARQIKNRKNR